jgi:hypothetical protein
MGRAAVRRAGLGPRTRPARDVAEVVDVANAPGTVCNVYADCVQLLTQGKKINYQGPAVTAGFDKYRNTSGDWLITQVGTDGKTQTGS